MTQRRVSLCATHACVFLLAMLAQTTGCQDGCPDGLEKRGSICARPKTKVDAGSGETDAAVSMNTLTGGQTAKGGAAGSHASGGKDGIGVVMSGTSMTGAGGHAESGGSGGAGGSTLEGGSGGAGSGAATGGTVAAQGGGGSAPVVGPCAGHAGENVCNGADLYVCGESEGEDPAPVTCGDSAACQVGMRTGVCGVCTPGTFRCEQAELSTCTPDGQYMHTTSCASAALCNEDVGKCTEMKCTPDAVSCSSDGKLLKTCNADGSAFASESQCADGCNSDLKQCNKCLPGKKLCADDGVVTCKADGTGFGEPQACPNGCNASKATCNACTPGVKMCSGNGVATCNADGGGFGSPMACPNGCNVGRAACNDCMPGAKTCNGNSLTTCTDGSGFGNPMSCPNGCNSGRNACNDCMPGARMCSGNSLLTCSADGTGFGNPMACPNGCNAARADCNDCMPGNKMCNGSSLVTCRSDGTGYGSPESCTNGCNSARKECNDCMPGAKSCNGSSLVTCSSDGGGFGSPMSCPNGCSQARGECNNCKPNLKTCRNNSEETCDANGLNTSSHACTAGLCKTPKCNGDSCGEGFAAPGTQCMDNTHECDGAGNCIPKSLCRNEIWDYLDKEECDPTAAQWKGQGAVTCTADCKLKPSIYGVCQRAGEPCWPGGGGWFCSAVGSCTRVCDVDKDCPGGRCIDDPVTANQKICISGSGCAYGTNVQWVGREGCFLASQAGCENAKPLPPVQLCGWLSADPSPSTTMFWCPNEVAPCCPPVAFGSSTKTTPCVP